MPLAFITLGSMLVRPHSLSSTAPATPEIYTLSLHDALPISVRCCSFARARTRAAPSAPCSDLRRRRRLAFARTAATRRSEEHTSELQSLTNIVCRLVLGEKTLRRVSAVVGDERLGASGASLE